MFIAFVPNVYLRKLLLRQVQCLYYRHTGVHSYEYAAYMGRVGRADICGR